MHKLLSILPAAIGLFAPAVSSAETPADVFREMEARQRARLEGIGNYTQMKSTMGMCTLEHYEKESTESADGGATIEYMRLLSPAEVAERSSPDTAMGSMSPAELDAVAAELRQQGPRMEAAFLREMQSADLPGGIGLMLMNPPPGKPWLSANPNDMMGMYATMLEGAAEGKRQDAERAAIAEQEAKTNPLAGIAERTRIVGREAFGNREAIVLIAEDLDWTPPDSGGEFTLNTLRLWVDAADYVTLKMSMEGVAREGGDSREVRIEREDSGYQSGAGCGDFRQPLRSVMRVSGVLSPAEEAQMAEARLKLAEFKLQMDAMPPAQRDMIMRQMGPQFEMMEKMAAGNGIEVVSLVTGMRCNAGLPSQQEYAGTLPGNAATVCDGFRHDSP